MSSLPRPWAAALGLALLAFLWIGPPVALAERSFTAHMVMHMGVVAVAAALLALAVAGGGLDPARRWPRLLAPIPASFAELIVVWGWHAPVLHHAARHRPALLLVEQLSFLAVGLWLWSAALGGDRSDRSRTAAGIVGLLLTSMHMTLLGALLVLSPRPLYAHAEAPAWGLSPIADQHLGGAVMLLVGGAAYLLGGLGLTAGVLRAPREREEVG